MNQVLAVIPNKNPPPSEPTAKQFNANEEAQVGAVDTRALPSIIPTTIVRLLNLTGKDGQPTPIFKTSVSKGVADIIGEKGYTLLEVIGRGAFGCVYRAHYDQAVRIGGGGPPALTYDVACKQIDLVSDKKKTNKTLLGFDKRRLETLGRELTVMEKLVHHQHVISLYEHLIIDYQVFIIMEYAHGGSLFQYLKDKGALPERFARKFMLQLCDAVRYMHSKGFSHRDLKLQNILIMKPSKRGTLKIADFGLSRVHYTGDYLCYSHCGTPLYMAPEIIAVKMAQQKSELAYPYNPMRSDIWALGICLYALLNRAWPFDDDKTDMYARMLNRDWKFSKKIRESVSPELLDFLNALLEPDPRKRITFFGIYSHRWFLDSK